MRKKIIIFIFLFLLFNIIIAECKVYQFGYKNKYSMNDIICIINREWDKAIDKFTKVIRNDPKDYSAHHYRAVAYLSKGLIDEAISDCTQSIRLNPNIPEVYNTRAAAYKYKGLYTEVIDDISKSIELNPNDSDSYNIRAVEYEIMGDFESALKDYNKALEIDPNNKGAIKNRAQLYLKNNLYKEAISDFDRIIEDMKIEDADCYAARGYAISNLGLSDMAILDYEKAIKIDPGNPSAYYYIGLEYQYNKKDINRAILNYTKAIELKPDCIEVLYQRSIAYMDKQSCDKAIEGFSKVIALQPKHGNAYLKRAMAYVFIEEYEKSWADIDRAERLGIKIDDEVIKFIKKYSGKRCDSRELYLFGKEILIQGKTEKAEEYFQKIINQNQNIELVKLAKKEIEKIEMMKRPALMDTSTKDPKIALGLCVIAVALELYKIDNDRYPTTEEGLEILLKKIEVTACPGAYNGPYLKILTNDYWGNKYQYRSSVHCDDYELFSYGPDGKEGGEDDIFMKI